MKKILLCSAALIAAMAVNAQVQVVTIDGKAWCTANGSEDEGSSAFAVAAGTVICEIEGAAVMKNGADTNYKAAGTTQSGFSAVVADDAIMDFASVSGVQGQDNPKDEDGNTGWSSFKAPATGAFTTIEVAKDGYLAVVAKYSSNKNYTVFEEGTCIPYTLAMEWSAGVEAGAPENYNPLTYTLPGVTDEEGITTYDKEKGPIMWPEQIVLGEESAIKKNGVGVIIFQVFADCKYNCNAWGSKIAPQGMFFSEKPFETILVRDTKEGAKEDFVIYSATGDVTAISSVNAAPKAIVTYNLYGQRVNNAKGLVIENGKVVLK